MSIPYPTTLRVHRIERPYWSHNENHAKNHWDGLYTSSDGLVRVFAHKPYGATAAVDRPGFIYYTVIADGFEIAFREGRYRTPRGACIMAGRLVRMIAGFRGEGYTREYYESKLNERWSQMYAGKLESK